MGEWEKWRMGEWRMGEWENGRMGEWENGRNGEWENGRMGEWESRKREVGRKKSTIRNQQSEIMNNEIYPERRRLSEAKASRREQITKNGKWKIENEK